MNAETVVMTESDSENDDIYEIKHKEIIDKFLTGR